MASPRVILLLAFTAALAHAASARGVTVCHSGYGECKRDCGRGEFRWHSNDGCSPIGYCCVSKSLMTAAPKCRSKQGVCLDASKCGRASYTPGQCGGSSVCCNGVHAFNNLVQQDYQNFMSKFSDAISEDVRRLSQNSDVLNIEVSEDGNWLTRVGNMPVHRVQVDRGEVYASKWFDSRGNPQPTHFQSPPNKFLVHTLQVYYPRMGDLDWSIKGFDASGYWPHFTIGHNKRGKLEIIQYIPMNRPALALSGHNLENNIQVEIGGKAEIPFHFDRDLNTGTALLWRAVHHITNSQRFKSQFRTRGPGVPLSVDPRISFHKDKAYGKRASQRLNLNQFRALRGLCGHQHAPDQTHWDPGCINPHVLLETARRPRGVSINGKGSAAVTPIRSHAGGPSASNYGGSNGVRQHQAEQTQQPPQIQVPTGVNTNSRSSASTSSSARVTPCKNYPDRQCRPASECTHGFIRGQCPGRDYCCNPPPGNPPRPPRCRDFPDRTCRPTSQCSRGFIRGQCPGVLYCCNP
eukprot:TRINITY_DN34_c0_g1_i2.p1 TRINITY_DN34_c0_g1~~TRINITY_DN34_c0_g1_i2.p1  ORF type:complete len:520 (+),score=75.73 TRINITY_DN34_c0_g1_i2:256-1815(+)